MECKKCHGKKYLRDEKGKFVPCLCILQDQVLRYLSPLKRFITPNAANVKRLKLINKSQAVVMTDQNMVGLIGFVAEIWYPKTYKIITLEEINTIGFGQHHEFKSIYHYINRCTNFILDCGFLNKIRARKDGFKENDSLYAIELVKNVLAKEDGTIIIIVPSNFQNFVKDYRDLCECLTDLGIECFRNEKYQPLLNKEKGGNDEQPISN